MSAAIRDLSAVVAPPVTPLTSSAASLVTVVMLAIVLLLPSALTFIFVFPASPSVS
jgi:hypothetical protein